MKKIYITPATDSVEVKLQTMIAGSITLNDEGGTFGKQIRSSLGSN